MNHMLTRHNLHKDLTIPPYPTNGSNIHNSFTIVSLKFSKMRSATTFFTLCAFLTAAQAAEVTPSPSPYEPPRPPIPSSPSTNPQPSTYTPFPFNLFIEAFTIPYANDEVRRTGQFYEKYTVTVPASITPVSTATVISSDYGPAPYTYLMNYYSLKDLPDSIKALATGPSIANKTQIQSYFSVVQTYTQPFYCTNTQWTYTSAGVWPVPEPVQNQVTPIATLHANWEEPMNPDGTTYVSVYYLLDGRTLPGYTSKEIIFTRTTGSVADSYCTFPKDHSWEPSYVSWYTPATPTATSGAEGGSGAAATTKGSGGTAAGAKKDEGIKVDEKTSAASGRAVEMWTGMMGLAMGVFVAGICLV